MKKAEEFVDKTPWYARNDPNRYDPSDGMPWYTKNNPNNPNKTDVDARDDGFNADPDLAAKAKKIDDMREYKRLMDTGMFDNMPTGPAWVIPPKDETNIDTIMAGLEGDPFVQKVEPRLRESYLRDVRDRKERDPTATFGELRTYLIDLIEPYDPNNPYYDPND